MAPTLDWGKLMKVDPDALPNEERLAEKMLKMLVKVNSSNLKGETNENLIQLFRITQSLVKIKSQEVDFVLEEAGKTAEEQVKTENQLRNKMKQLENEMEMAQLSTGTRDSRFLREEIRQLEEQLGQKQRELKDTRKELEKEKQVNERLALRNEETDNENSKLRRENEQLRQDVIDFQRQIDSQRETLMSRGEGQDYKTVISKKNMELVQYLDEIQSLSEANERLEAQNLEMTKNLEESVQEMEKMTDEYSKMKLMVQQSDSVMDQLRKEKDHYRLQVTELTEQLKAKNEEDDPVMVAVNLKVEEWKGILASKDEEISEYQQMVHNLREKLKVAELDADKSSVLALQQGLQERDSHIKMLTEQLEQHTKEMESYSLHIEDLKRQLQAEKGDSSYARPNRAERLEAVVQLTEQRLREAERIAELAENDARQKDEDLIDATRRMKEYETGIYGLEEAVAEIKELKSCLKIRDHEIETLTTDINKLGLKMNDILDENEDLRERLGLDPKTVIDLTEFKNVKNLKQQQYRAENQVLLKEIERLEEERIELKQQVRKLAQEKGKKSATLGLMADDLDQNTLAELALKQKGSGADEIRGRNEHLSRQLNDKERDLERSRTVLAELKSKLKGLSEENKQLQQGMGEILQAIKDSQKDSNIKGSEATLIIPSLERLVHAFEMKNTSGIFDVGVHLKAQVDQLTGRNEELRQELKGSRKEAAHMSNLVAKANEKITHLEKEVSLSHQSEGANIVFKAVNLPEGMSLSSTNLINSINEYLLHLLQEVESKEKSVVILEEALEEYKRKLAVMRHQQGLIYKEYQSDRESWQVDIKRMKEEISKLEGEKEQDTVQIKEYMNLLEALKMAPDEVKNLLSENFRKMTVLRVNEKSLTRRYTTLLEMEQHLRKENDKLKSEESDMEVAVGERIGYLQRYKDVAAFKVASLQKALDGSIPLSELETANKQYNDLTAKYRDMLQKDNWLVQRTANLEHVEHENASLKSQMTSYIKELEIAKEKLNTLEQAWEHTAALGGNSAMDKATKAITNNEIISISKKITMLEMKELNERQKAEHSQKMYEHLRITLKQLEERNFELESKFAELTKINLEAQKVEQTLRDELADSVSKEVSDADRRRIMELEKSEAQLMVEASKLRSVSDIAKAQVSTLVCRQQSREKEVESLRKQVLDFQDQTDEKALIAKLHQQIVALQISESTAVAKLEAATSKLQKMEAYSLRLEQKIDDKEQALYYARLEGRNRAKHLRHTIQTLRRQFSGALPLPQQEKFSKTLIELQTEKLKTAQEMQLVQQERKDTEIHAAELELKLKGLEELISTLKDARGAQKVTEWHHKMEELRLQDMKLTRELNQKKEEIKYLSNLISEQERTMNNLEEELVQQRKFHEERQMSWDQREVELERQLDLYEQQQHEVLSTARKFEEATGKVPDASLPLPQQLDIALRKIKEHVRTILETKSICRTLEEEQQDSAKKHAEDLKALHQKLDLHSDASITKFKEAALELMKKPTLQVPPSAHLMRMAEMEQTVAEQDSSLSTLTNKLKNVTAELERQKQSHVAKVNELENSRARLEEDSVLEVKRHKSEAEELRVRYSEMEKEINYLNAELEAQKEANTRAPTATMKNLVERLKGQVVHKEKQQKALSKALLALRAEMTAHAEQQIISAAAQKEESLNIQQIVDRQTKDLKARIEDLHEQLLKLKETLKSSKARESNLSEDLENLNQEMRGKQKIITKLHKEKEDVDRENEELKKRLKRLASSTQSKSDLESKQNLIDELQKKVKRLEVELEKKTEEAERKPAQEDKSSKQEIIRWEEGKKWQIKIEGTRSKLREKEKEVEALTKQLTTLKDLYSKAEQEKIVLQRKLKSRGITADQVVGVRAVESEKEMEELRRKNMELENEISYMKTKQALPRDSVVDELHLKNQYLQEKLQVLERQLSRDNLSRPSNIEADPEKKMDKLKYAVTPMTRRSLFKRIKEKTLLIEDDADEHMTTLSYCRTQHIETIAEDNVDVLNYCPSVYNPNNATAVSATASDVGDDLCRAENATCSRTPPASNTPSPRSCDASRSASVAPSSKPGDTSLPVSTTATPGLGDASVGSTQAIDDIGDIDCQNTFTTSPSKPSRTNTIQDAKESQHYNDGWLGTSGEKPEKELSYGHPINSDTECPTASEGGQPYPYSDIKDNKCHMGGEDVSENDHANKLDMSSDLNPHLQTSGVGSEDPTSREMELQRENLRLSAENVEIQFQLEQANKDLPRLKDQIANLKEMCDLLKKDKLEAERKLGNVRGSGRSGKTVPELEKTIGLMKRVVERVQRENEELKKAPGVVANEKISNLELQNENLKSELEKLQLHVGGQLSMRYEAKTKGMEKVIAENERLRKELKSEIETSEKLRISKRNLEVVNEKLSANLEDTRNKLSFAESRGPQLEGTDGKAWKSVVVSRMYETKMKEMEAELLKRNDSIVDLKRLLKEATERERKTEQTIQHLRDEIDLLKHFPEDAKTDHGLSREFQILRLTNKRLENEKAELLHQLQADKQSATFGSQVIEKDSKYNKLMEEVVDLQTHIKTSDLEKLHMKEEIKRLKKELENFDPTFFEEIEDLKYNYNEEVKKNILLEEKLKALSQQFGVHIDLPTH
ncbi:centrosomal protein of 290 kDa isoform 2-T2 [Anomaloglossus baeobatrachus]|uniref:centrosomal protein of 290 kDa isoform X2 n=1 Tax=Anomaloglossus baeobatrachus TaxID=238106 RepID=UPI003F4FA21D